MKSIIIGFILALALPVPAYAALTAEERQMLDRDRQEQQERKRDLSHAACRIAAYQAQASNVADYTIACMLLDGWTFRSDGYPLKSGDYDKDQRPRS